MTLLWPQFLLLLIPLAAFLFLQASNVLTVNILRAVMAGCLCLALASPSCSRSGDGRDVLVVVDQSRSMPQGASARAEEAIALLAAQRGPRDRLGVVSFAQTSRVDMGLQERSVFGGFSSQMDAEASNLAQALEAASQVIPAHRKGRVLVFSDGKLTGGDAVLAARRLKARDIEVDVRTLTRADSEHDVAVVALTTAPQVSSKEPFLLTATVQSVRAERVQVTLWRNGRPIAKSERALTTGANLLTMRDVVEHPGLQQYEVRVETEGDSVAENDVGRAVVRVSGPSRILLLTNNPTGALANMLTAEKFALEVKAPFALSLEALDGISAVVLEDIEASALSEKGLFALQQFVALMGGGLVMTGGKHAFGEGGYRKSVLEDLLPVTLEMREEQRKAAIAISIIMDCSCSMGATVPDGRTKMELAAEGVVGALQLLNQNDEASVHMVDTEPHSIFDLRPVSDGLPLGKVASGFSGGGGIFIGVGLRTAKREILASHKETRHVLLFTDAADSEEADDYRKTLAELAREKVTVSVIGLGTKLDPDAKLLEEIAILGKGRMYFADDALSLPRIFSQETIAVARATFVDVLTQTRFAQDLAQLGKTSLSDTPQVGGYNLTYLKPQASVALRSEDDNRAPLISFWPNGNGRTAAVAIELDGDFTGPWRSWSGASQVLGALVRWVMPPSLSRDVVAKSSLSQNRLQVRVDFATESAKPNSLPTLTVLDRDGLVVLREVPMRWDDEGAVAEFMLPKSGTFHPVLTVGKHIISPAPVTLPWSPEFEPVPASLGVEALKKVAQAGGGREIVSLDAYFSQGLASVGQVDVTPILVIVLLFALVSEVFARRFLSPRNARTKSSQSPLTAAAKESLLAGTSEQAPTQAVRAVPQDDPAQTLQAVPKAPEGTVQKSAFEQAKERAKKRTER
jgi:uncharacterized membrane protein